MGVESLEIDSKAVDKKKESARNKRNNIFIALGVIFLLIGVVGLAIVCGMFYATKLSELEYGIVFDAGSSHTSMYLYQWKGDKVNGTGQVEQIDMCDVEDGTLTDYVDNPSAAGPQLKECLDKAAKEIPWAQKWFTPVYLGATAGMRIEKLEDPNISDQIMESVQKEILNSGFQVSDIDEQVKILEGKDEGIGLWVTVNYAAGTLGIILEPEHMAILPLGVEETLGSLDLGGASTQVAFALGATTKAPVNETDKLTLYSKKLTVFSDSFLCFGASEMRKQVLAILTKDAEYEGEVNHPCYAVGFEDNVTYSKVFQSICTEPYADATKQTSNITVVGTGNNTECQNVMKKLFDVSPYYEDPHVTLPKRLLARGAFAYAVADLTRDDPVTQLDYTTYVDKMNAYCASTHDVIKQYDVYDAKTVCINSQYIYYLLHDIYKIPNDYWTSILFTNKLNDIDLGWALGYMANITTALPHNKLDLYSISVPVFIAVVVITSALIVLGISAVVFACRFKRAQYDSLRQPMAEPF